MPETIGQQLKAAREAHNLTFAKVTQAIHIQARLLEAMESDDFQALPSPVQGRAFLRLYAEYLGLSLDEMIARQRASAGEPAPAEHPSSPIPTPPSGEEPAADLPAAAERASELPPGRSLGIVDKVKEILQRIRRPQEQAGQSARPVEAVQLSLPLIEAEPASTQPDSSSEAPADDLDPALPIQADPDEADASEPLADELDDPSQPATLASEPSQSQQIFSGIGQSLRQRREALSLTFEEIEHHTHVRIHYLQALENGDFDHLPSSVQTRGMLNNYAHFLDMDMDAILLQFAEGLQAKRLERQPEEPERTSRKNVSRTPKAADSGKFRRYFSMDILVGGGLIIILLAFAIWGTSRVIALHADITTQPTSRSISDILVGSSGTVTFTPTPSLAGTETILPTGGVTAIGTIPASGPGPVQVVVAASEQSYLRVTVDGKVQFDGRILEGIAYSFSGNDQIEVLTGNGAGISILFNQGNLGPMGRLGQVVDRIYTAKAILNPTPTNTPTPTITPTFTITPRNSPTPTNTATLLLPPATP